MGLENVCPTFHLGLGAPTTGNTSVTGYPLLPCGVGRAGRRLPVAKMLQGLCPDTVSTPAGQMRSLPELVFSDHDSAWWVFVSIRTTLVFANPFKLLSASAVCLEQSLPAAQPAEREVLGDAARSLNPCQVSIPQSVSGL